MSYPDPPAAAVARGHDLEPDPPHALSTALRWTCRYRSCGRAVLNYRGNVYGAAVDTDCPVTPMTDTEFREAMDGVLDRLTARDPVDLAEHPDPLEEDPTS